MDKGGGERSLRLGPTNPTGLYVDMTLRHMLVRAQHSAHLHGRSVAWKLEFVS